MKHTLHILSQALSILLHPIFMPTYGMILYAISVQNSIINLSTPYILLCCLGTLILTAIIPIVLMLLLKKYGQISSLQLSDAKQRTTPYIYTLICYIFWCFFVKVSMNLPQVWFVIAIGSSIAILLITIINHRWKISAHLTGIGGLLGGICSISYAYPMLSMTLIIIILLLSLLLMYARIYLEEHSPTQVVCGYLLGMLCTFTPTLIVYA